MNTQGFKSGITMQDVDAVIASAMACERARLLALLSRVPTYSWQMGGETVGGPYYKKEDILNIFD